MSDAIDSLENIPLGKIRENPVALRQVNRNTEKYLELVASIVDQGLLNPIVVRPLVDPETKEQFYGLIDGLHRYTACQDAGLATIPAHVKSMADADVLVAQIIGNIHRIETRPVEYSKQLQKILAQDPRLTSSILARQLGKSTTWIADRLGLLKIEENVSKLVDEGKINLSNAFALAKLPKEEQAGFVDRAITMPPQEFSSTVMERKKQLDKARREGRPVETDFVAPVHMRKMKDVKNEFENPRVSFVICKENKLKTPEEGFALAVAWILNQDPTSIAIAKQVDDERKNQLREKRDKMKNERVKQKASFAAVHATRLSLESDLLDQGADEKTIKAQLQAFDDANGLVNGKIVKETAEVAEA